VLSHYFKHNKKVYKKFKAHVDCDSTKLKKRTRRDSAVSELSVADAEKPKKRQRTSSINSVASVKSREGKTRQKSVEVVLPPSDEIVAAPFKRIDESKFVGKIGH
jgi:hypothetical protein